MEARWSPRSSDRGSIAAPTARPCGTSATRVTAVLGPRLHCGGTPCGNARAAGVSPRSSDRGSIAAAPARYAHRIPHTVTAVLGPRLHCGWRIPAVMHRPVTVTAVLGPRLHCGLLPQAGPVRLPLASPRSSDRGSIAARRPARRRRSPDRVTAVLGPRLHCGRQPFARVAEHETVTAVLGPRLHCGVFRPQVQGVKGVRHRGPRTAAPLRHEHHGADRRLHPGVTAVLGPRLHCGAVSGSSNSDLLTSPRSSDRGSIAARPPGRVRRRGSRRSPRSSDRGSIAASFRRRRRRRR